MSTINQSINSIYNNKGFFDTYLSDVFITVILCIVFFVAISYFYIMNNIGPIIADWDNKKCSPAVLPFAGLINNGPTTTKFEFTKQNFNSCMHTMVNAMASDATQPIHYVLDGFTKLFTDLKDALNDIRKEFDKIRTTIHMFSTDIMGRTLNITMPILQMVIGIKSSLGKVNGLLGATQYTLFGSYLSLKSMFMFFLGVVNDILIGLVASIVAAFILAIFFFPAELIAIGSIALMTAILVPVLLIQSFITDVFKISSASLPSVPSCFDGKTRLIMSDQYEKCIADIKPGEMLYGDGHISAVLKCSAQGQTIYQLDGVTVTGEHRVFHKVKGWLKVKDHEDSILLADYTEPFVYCLNTESKSIHINNTIFSDWDDIDENVISKLEEKCVKKSYLPEHFNGNDIHLYLENGLQGNTSFVSLENDELVLLRDIKVNDILKNGKRVAGIVKVDMRLIHTICEYNIYDISGNYSIIRGCRNIQIIENNEDIKAKKKEYIISENLYGDCFYQLLVEGGTFIVNGIEVGDYNTGLDKFLL
jgi:hypothetical protein